MRIAFAVLAALSLFAAASGGVAQSATTPPTGKAPGVDKKICRTDTPTGSMMAKRTCHSKAEWAQIDGTNAAGARDSQDHARPSGG